MANKEKTVHIFAEDMSDEMCEDALRVAKEAFQVNFIFF